MKNWITLPIGFESEKCMKSYVELYTESNLILISNSGLLPMAVLKLRYLSYNVSPHSTQMTGVILLMKSRKPENVTSFRYLLLPQKDPVLGMHVLGEVWKGDDSEPRDCKHLFDVYLQVSLLCGSLFNSSGHEARG
jgi:hypothetical protein